METDSLAAARRHMVESQLRSRGIRDERVLQAMSRVPRHEFVAPEFQHQAYEDHPLPIGNEQTISQPYIVAIMLEALNLAPSEIVLEVGTGSGYLTALLAELCGHVYSIELHESLASRSRMTLQRLGYGNVPKPLFDQLAEGGRMVMPVGLPEAQQLQWIRKQAGNPVVTVLEGVRFVPLLASAGKPISG